MAQQITQQLGFDATQAISAISQLNTSLGSMNANLNKAANAAARFNKAGLNNSLKKLSGNATKNLTNNLTKAGTATKNLNTNLKNAGTVGTKALGDTGDKLAKFTLSMETLSRIVVAQVLVRGFNKLTQAIAESNEQTRELETRIKEIQTIANGALGTDSDINKSLTNISKRFGLDVLDVAEAKYQELSNQVDGSTESILFQETAAKFARATNSSLTDSVNLLSSALNAFGKDASQSEEVAGILFKTIEQGRVRAGELANSFGRVAPLANALGIDLNELGASIARITQGGTKADTALTQILGILNKLSKPTEDLKEAFQELGVSTGLEGIQQSGGLLQFLTRLQEVAGDNTTLVEFFNNVRAIQGVLALLGTDAEKTGKVFDEFTISTDSATDALRSAINTATEGNTAFEYDQALQALNAQYRELSENLIPTSITILGTLDSIIDGITLATENWKGATVGTLGALTGLSILTGNFTVALGGLRAALIRASVALGPFIAPAAVAAVAAYGTVFAINALETNKWAGALKLARDEANRFQELTELNSKELREQASEFKNAAGEVAQYANQFLGLRKASLDTVTDLNSDFVSASTAALDAVLKARRSITQEIEQAISQADSAIEKSGKRQADLATKRDDFVFNRRLENLDDYRKSIALLEKSNLAAFDTRDLIRGATDLDTFDQAAGALDRRLKLAEQALQAAEASGNRNLIAQAEQEIVTALNDQINLERQRTQIIEQRKKVAKEAAAKERKQTEQLKNLTKDIRKELSFLSDNGGLLNEEQLAQNGQRVEELINKIRKVGLDQDQFDLTKFLGIEDLASRFQTELDDATNTISQSRGKVQGAIDEVFKPLDRFVDDNLIETAIDLGLTQGGPDQLKSLNEAAANASKEIGNLTSSQEKLDNALLELESKKNLFRDLFSGTRGDAQQVEQIQRIVDSLAEDGTEAGREFAERFVNELSKVANTAGNRINPLIPDSSIIDIGAGGITDSAALESILQLYDNIIEAQRKVAFSEATTAADRSRRDTILDFQKQAQEMILQVNELNSSTAAQAAGWAAVTGEIGGATQALRQYNAAQSQSGTPQNRMFGGAMLYRAAGGPARGTDTIPAMLSPGEFVVNSRASQKYATQLQAMNSDANPTFRSEGGPMTTNNTVNVGDINVNGTADADDTARRVVSQLRREFRRGTTSRFN